MSSTRAALEATLAANPDDVAAHHAYADLLIEEGDPRGEFIRLQLAREEPNLPAKQKKALEAAARALQKEHGAAWLGPLAPFLSTGGLDRIAVTFRRGWLHSVVNWQMTGPIREALAAAPIARLLAELTFHAKSLPLPRSPNLRNLRRLQLGSEGFERFTVLVSEDIEAIRAASRLESLSIISGATEPAAGFLAEMFNLFQHDGLTALRHLTLSLRGFGDAGVAELLGSPLLDRLQTLDLSRCDITDEGAQLLAAHPAVPRLESFHLDHNLLSPIGLDALAAVGVMVSARQYFVRGWTDEDELTEDSDLA